LQHFAPIAAPGQQFRNTCHFVAKHKGNGGMNMRKLLILLCAMCAIHPALADTYNITLNNINPLPSGYTQLEYLEGTGTQWLCTDIHPSVTMVSQIGVKMSAYTGYVIYGFYSGKTATYRLFNYKGSIYFEMNTGSTRLIGSNMFQNNVYYDLEIGNRYVKNLNTNTTLVSGSTLSSFSWDAQNYNMCLFSSSGTDTIGNGKIYYVSVYDNDTLAYKYIPARRNSDNVLGMYDIVGNTFKTNSGSGTFNTGDPILGSKTQTYTSGVGDTIDATDAGTRDGYVFAGWCTDSALTNCAMTQTIGTDATGDKTFYAKWACAPCDTTNASCSLSVVNGVCTYMTSCNSGYGNIQNNGAYNASCSPNTYNIFLDGVATSILPSGYTQLEYIQSTGAQYINTGFAPNQDTRVVMEFLVPDLDSSDWVFGARAGMNDRAFAFLYNRVNGGEMRQDYGYYNTNHSGPAAIYGQKIMVDMNKNHCDVYNESGTKYWENDLGSSSFQAPYQLVFPGIVDSSGYGSPAKLLIYSFKLYDNGTLIRDYVPAKRNSDNAIGMYDTVNDTFYPNAGTGTFTAGPAASGAGAMTYTYGVGATINEVPTRDGYVFAGWCTDSALTNCAMSQTISTTATGDKTFYAKWVENAGTTINCPAGEYLPMNANSCATCTANSYCGGGDYTPSDSTDQGIVSCSTGLFAPSGMWEAAQCGRILHVGDGFVYLRATKKTSPSLHLDLDHDGVADYFGNMTTFDVPMSRGTQRKLKVRYNNTTYSIYDDSVELPTE